jgi:hypothetical protein
MSFPNISDVLATTIENRSKKISDNVMNNNAILKKLETKGKMKTFSGGHKILQELSFAENANAGWYSGYDLLPVGASDVISAAEYEIKQAAVPVVISGLEQLQNAGKEQMIDLMEARLEVAETTLSNLIVDGVYSDGMTPTVKQIDGLDAMISTTPAVGQYGNIDPASWAFWRNYYDTATTTTTANIQGVWNTAWSNLVRGQDRPDLIMVDNLEWVKYISSLQLIQRFSSAETGQLGFSTVKFMDSDVCLDGGVYFPSAVTGATGASSNQAYFLNCKHLHYRPHAARNMVPLSPNRRYATNQDAEVQIIAWAGNLTCSARKLQGRVDGS